MSKELIKDISISILIVTAIVLIFSVILYDKISIAKVIPEAEEYKLTEQMQEDINGTQEDKEESVVTTYYIKADELKKYEKTKEYNKGKKNPFAAEAVNAVEAGNTTVANTVEEPSNTNTFYENDGTK